MQILAPRFPPIEEILQSSKDGFVSHSSSYPLSFKLRLPKNEGRHFKAAPLLHISSGLK